MYICICHGVNETTIRNAVKQGSRTLRELSFQTGCGTQCGNCVPQVQSLLRDCIRAEQSAGVTPFLRVVAVS
jgi:bacterioferritin-associated ferredoxin